MNNSGIPFDQKLIDSIFIIENVVKDRIRTFQNSVGKVEYNKGDVIRAISCLDLTSLNATDTPTEIDSLLSKSLADRNGLRVASVCVYQPFIKQAKKSLKNTSIGVAVVAGGFPAGQMDVEIKCADIEKSVALGATEIDVVINRAYPLTENWPELYDEVKAFKTSCDDAKLKVILATGELKDYTNITRTSWVCMMAGADFIKTSTGLEKVNATLEAGYTMMTAIDEFAKLTGNKVGIKPAGGIRTTQEAMMWLQLLKEELGEKWANKSLFRIGASSLLDDLASHLN